MVGVGRVCGCAFANRQVVNIVTPNPQASCSTRGACGCAGFSFRIGMVDGDLRSSSRPLLSNPEFADANDWVLSVCSHHRVRLVSWVMFCVVFVLVARNVTIGNRDRIM